MNPKRILIGEEAKQKFTEGISDFSAAVKATLGPGGKTVILESNKFLGGFTVTKDGATIADEIFFADAVKDLAATFLKRASRNTAEIAGDGTSTSVVLTEAILKYYEELKTSKSRPSQVAKYITEICERMILELDKIAVPVDEKTLESIATISTNNDPLLGKLISDAFKQSDFVSISDSNNEETHFGVIKGIKFHSGYMNRFFVNEPNRDRCVLTNAKIIIANKEIENLHAFDKILAHCIDNHQPLVVIASMSVQALQAFSSLVARGLLKGAVVNLPYFGHVRAERISDIADVIGANLFSSELGDTMQILSIEDMGTAKKITITQSETIIEPDDESQLRINAKVEELMSTIIEGENKNRIEERIKAINTNNGIIYVGATTDLEAKEKKDRIEDAVLAVKSAKSEGIVAGGGKSLIAVSAAVKSSFIGQSVNDDLGLAIDVMRATSMEPLRQMLTNLDSADMFDEMINVIHSSKPNEGYDLMTMEFCNLIERGVVDPVKVTKSALKNAVSVATSIINSGAVITNIRTHDTIK